MPLYPARNLNFINLKDYCKIDGSSDDSTNFTNAYTLASSLGMGLYMPGGTLVKGNSAPKRAVSISRRPLAQASQARSPTLALRTERLTGIRPIRQVERATHSVLWL